MVRRVSAAEAKAHFSALLARVAYAGERYVIERRGKPIAALVNAESLARLESEQATSPKGPGALAVVGAWRDVNDEDIEMIVTEIYAERERDTGRPVELED